MSKVLKRVLLSLVIIILVAVVALCAWAAISDGSSVDKGNDAGTSSDTGTNSGTGTGSGTDTGSDTGTNSGTGTGSGTDTGSDTGTNSGTDTGSDTGTNSGTDTGSDTGTNSGTDTGSDTGTNSGTDTGTNSGTGTDSGSSYVKYDGLFAGTSTQYALTSDYTLTEEDVKATQSSGSSIALGYLCSFNLGGHNLDLGGYTLKISTASDKVIKFENGKITNGTLNISIPNGDIEFTDTEIDDSVTYELEAASETIRFSNALIGGKCTVKSNTRVSVEYSNVRDLAFTGNGTLTAGSGASLGEVSVGATGATLNIAPTAKVDKVALNAPATVNVSGNVKKLVIESSGSGSSVKLNKGSEVETVAVKGSNTKIENDGADVMQVVVADDVAGSLNASGVAATSVSSADMDKYIDHMHVLKLVSSKGATCTTDGEEVYACTCGEKSVKTIPASGHDYVQIVVKEPTATADGIYSFKCSDCGDENTVTISKNDAKYYHMNVAMVNKSENTYETVCLKYVKDDSGEYYLLTKTLLCGSGGSFDETVYTVKLLSKTGLPEVKPTASGYCNEWIKLTLDHTAEAEVTKTTLEGNRVSLTASGYEVTDGVRGATEKLGAQSVDFGGNCYYNEETRKTSFEEVHKLTATGKYADGSTSCQKGIIVTVSCDNCGYTKTETLKEHYYAGTNDNLITQCGGDGDVFNDRECIVCHTKDFGIKLDGYKHKTSNVYKTIRSEKDYDDYVQKHGAEAAENALIKITDLSAHGFDVEGFHFGSYTLTHCAVCGINVHKYTYNTYTQANGCMRHTAIFTEYKGNVDFEAFECLGETSVPGHCYGYSDAVYYDSVDDALSEVATYIDALEVPFTPVKASYNYYLCLGCDLKVSKFINLYNDKNEYFRLTLEYENDVVANWSYRYDYYFETAVDRATNYYGLDVTFATIGDGELRRSKGGEVSEYIRLFDVCFPDYSYNIPLREDNNTEFQLIRDGDYMHTDIYAVKYCYAEMQNYNLSDSGFWTTNSSGAYGDERHFYHVAYGENCKEDGRGCKFCDKETVDYHLNIWGISSQYWESLHMRGDLSGLDASFESDFCGDCGSYIGMTVVLRDDWTLNGDVYLKSEGITIDLNGYSIDLNGYSLVIYSYAGAGIVITDNSFDTSSIPDYDPDTYTEYTAKITNSGATGVLALANSTKFTGEADIVLGTIAIESELFASDTDDRGTLYNSLLAKGYDLPIVIPEQIFTVE